jgi:hypothetical protein
MRWLVLVVLAVTTTAAADPAVVVHIDSVLGIDDDAPPQLDGVDAALGKCSDAPTGSAVVLLYVSRQGRVTSAHAHGAGKLDACLEHALVMGKVTAKLSAPIVLLGRVDLGDQPTPRISNVAIVIDAHDAAWQVTVDRLGYTANRALDIGQELDAASAAIAACASRRPRTAKPVHGVAWTDGHPIVHTGLAAYDSCLEHALAAIKLPRDDSAMWMELSIAPPAEPLAPRNPGVISHETQLRDALTTAVRARKLHLLGCLDGHPKATLVKLGVSLRGSRANVKTVATGDAEADACVRKQLSDVMIPSATSTDVVDLEVTLDPE